MDQVIVESNINVIVQFSVIGANFNQNL